MRSPLEPTDHFDHILRDARAERARMTMLWGEQGSSAFKSWMARYRWHLLLIAASLASALSFAHGSDSHALPIMLGIGIAATASSIGGFAFSAIAGAILFHLSDDTVQVVQIMITCSIANQIVMVWRIRQTISWQDLRPFLPGGFLGVIVGVALLLTVDRTTYTHVLGVFLACYGGFMLMRKHRVVKVEHTALTALAAFLSGVAGGVAGFPGAFIVAWVGLKDWDKTRQRALFQPFILMMQMAAMVVISLAPHAATSHSGYELANMLFIPLSLLGTTVGLGLYGRLSNQQFGRVMNATLVAAGIAYLL
jgi:uncharacterized membrane protein YfcA